MKRLDYNRMADEQSFNGWSLDELIARLASDAARQYGRCGCREKRACIHAAAAALDGIVRIVLHPDDCAECARLRDERHCLDSSSDKIE